MLRKKTETANGVSASLRSARPQIARSGGRMYGFGEPWGQFRTHSKQSLQRCPSRLLERDAPGGAFLFDGQGLMPVLLGTLGNVSTPLFIEQDREHLSGLHLAED